MNTILFPYIHIFAIFLKATSFSAAAPSPDWMLHGLETTVTAAGIVLHGLCCGFQPSRSHTSQILSTLTFGGHSQEAAKSVSVGPTPWLLYSRSCRRVREAPVPLTWSPWADAVGWKKWSEDQGLQNRERPVSERLLRQWCSEFPQPKKKLLLLTLSLLHQPILHTEGTHTALQAALQPSSRWWDRTAAASLRWVISGLRAAGELLLVLKTTAWILNSLPVSGFHLPACPEQWSTCWPFICMCSSNYQRRKYKREIMLQEQSSAKPL